MYVMCTLHVQDNLINIYIRSMHSAMHMHTVVCILHNDFYTLVSCNARYMNVCSNNTSGLFQTDIMYNLSLICI